MTKIAKAAGLILVGWFFVVSLIVLGILLGKLLESLL